MQRKNNIRKLLALFLLLPFVGAGTVFAQELDVKELIFNHIGDSYSWHITQWGDKDIAIPLPVIVKGKQSGWHLFLSSRLEHGAAYRGFYLAHEGDFAGKIVELDMTDEAIRPAIDISLTKNAVALMISCIVLLLVIMPLAKWYKRGDMKPAKGFPGAVEMLLMDIQEGMIKVCVGEDYKRFSPYLLTAFFFIFINNVLGLIPFFPGGANVTGNIAVTLFLALCTFFTVNVFGNKAYWKEIFWPDVPILLKAPAPLMPVIEFIGIITKPFALMIRLFANITAGHAIMLGLFCLIFITASMGAAINASMSVMAILFTCFMTFIELLVAYIQAYVFTLLSSVFIGMARAKHQTHTR
jgi:F-type H+-transporting ATPase subunit a